MEEKERPEEFEREEEGLYEKVVYINRVTKVVKGGRRFKFSSGVVVGDGNGNVGYGLGKGREVVISIQKGIQKAKKNMINFPLAEGRTIPFEVKGKCGAARVLLKPASPGTGIIAGHATRAVLEAAGVKDILSKSFGSRTPHNVVKATIEALKLVKKCAEIDKIRRSLILSNEPEVN